MEKSNGDLHFLCKVNAYSEFEDSTCSTLYELQVGAKVYPKGASYNGKMHMDKKFGTLQVYLCVLSRFDIYQDVTKVSLAFLFS